MYKLSPLGSQSLCLDSYRFVIIGVEINGDQQDMALCITCPASKEQ